MYIVHNTTTKTVMLSDLRAEIRPRAIVDLEKITDRDSIEKSRDLKYAIQTKRLQLGRHSVVRTRSPVEDPVVIEKKTTIKQVPYFDEDRLAAVVRRVVSEEMPQPVAPPPAPPPQNENVGEAVKSAVENSLGTLMDSIRDQIGAVGRTPEEEEMSIDPERFAELKQRSVSQISDEIETGGTKKARKVEIINPNLKDLASEL